MSKKELSFAGVIPARYGSSRLPGKPLERIGEKTMINHVYERASRVFEHLYVATDDERIKREVERFGGKAVMTSPRHQSGTDRCLEAVEYLESRHQKYFDVVVNIQGDEPLIEAESLRQLKECFSSSDCEMATLAFRSEPENPEEPSGVYVVTDDQDRALYFSRSVIPHVRDDSGAVAFLKHIGLYAYRRQALKDFSNMPPSSLEQAEKLEQLRWLQAGRKIQVAVTRHQSVPVDTPEDLEKVRKLMKS